MSSGWIGVDLDGTLAYYSGWKGIEHVGDPVPAMINRVRAWLANGTTGVMGICGQEEAARPTMLRRVRANLRYLRKVGKVVMAGAGHSARWGLH